MSKGALIDAHVLWHDLECGSYGADLGLWLELAAEHGGPVLDVGAGSGRVSLALARAGHRVLALDSDPGLLEALGARASGLSVETVLGDARDFQLGLRVPLCIVPMQTVQLLGGEEGRAAFLSCAGAHLVPQGWLAVAVSDRLDLYEVPEERPGPTPDRLERDGALYLSYPTAVRSNGDGVILERRREVRCAGAREVSLDQVRLDAVAPERLEAEARAVGLEVVGRRHVAPTPEYAGSVVVLLRG